MPRAKAAKKIAPKTTEQKTTEPKAGSRKKLLRFVLLGVVPALAIAGGVNFWLQGARYVSTQNAYVKTDIAKLAAEVSGPAIEVNAHAHMLVTAGDVLVKIDPRPFKLALASSEAELDATRQQVKTLRVTLDEAMTELEEAEDRASYFRKRYERQIDLAKRGIVSATRGDELENDANAAGDRVVMARQKISRIRASLGGAPDRPVDKHPQVRSKIAAVDQARLDLEHTSVKAPSSGTVVTVPLVPGEQITASKPLFAIVTDKTPWVDANYKETDLTHVRVGQSATIELDTYPGVSWKAKVKSISPATGAEFAILPPQNASGNWVKVVQRLPVRLQLESRSGMPPLRAGMTANVTIDTGRERSLTDLLGGLVAVAKVPPSDSQ
jgi:membrane fusion protein (multidrug efflux system)